jgi:hypothetical protein
MYSYYSTTDGVAEEAIKGMIDENCFITLREIKATLQANHQLNVAESTIHESIKRFEYSFKIVGTIVTSANTPAIKQERLQFANWSVNMALQQREPIYIGESGFSISVRPRLGRSPVGKTPISEVPRIRGRNITFIAAMTRNMLHYSILDNYQNGNARQFALYIDDFARWYLFSLKNVLIIILLIIIARKDDNNIFNPILVMDNVRFHHSPAVIDMISGHGFELRILTSIFTLFSTD